MSDMVYYMRRDKKNRPSYEALLNKKDPVDAEILRLAREGRIRIRVVELGGSCKNGS